MPRLMHRHGWRGSGCQGAGERIQGERCLSNEWALDEGGVSNVLWSYAALRFSHKASLQKVLDRGINLAEQNGSCYAPEQIGSLLWSCLQLGLDAKPLLSSLNLDVSVLRMEGPRGVPVVQILWSAVTAGWRHRLRLLFLRELLRAQARGGPLLVRRPIHV